MAEEYYSLLKIVTDIIKERLEYQDTNADEEIKHNIELFGKLSSNFITFRDVIVRNTWRDYCNL